jgi:hypothetical protein
LGIESSRGSRGNYDEHINPACKDGQITGASFPQVMESCSGKRENKSSLPFTFLMRTSIALCQTEYADVVCEQVLKHC